LFHYNTGGAPGGYTDFDKVTVDEPHPHGLPRPIPVGRTITLATAGDREADRLVLAVKDGQLSAVPAQDLRATGPSARFEVVDRGSGRVALRSAAAGYVSVMPPGAAGQVVLKTGEPADAETFQWMETPYGDLILLSLATHRYLGLEPGGGAVNADRAGPEPDRKDGTCLTWKESGW